MPEGYSVLEGTQTDINRRLLRKITALEKKVKILEENMETSEDNESSDG